MFRYVRHPELIGAVTKYAAFLALPHIPYLYILPLILVLVLIPSTIQLRN
jgi:protein-S-isoprenylcysteine O-methyltransferase Ste14